MKLGLTPFAFVALLANCRAEVTSESSTELRASGPTRLARVANDWTTLDEGVASIAVRLVGAGPIAGRSSGGRTEFPEALPGVDFLLTARDHGFEDHLRVLRPGTTSARYRLRLDKGIVGLRSIGPVLELLDERGVPRIRTYAPVLVDAKGVERHGVLDVEGCAVDHDARPPWGRPVTRTGATECTLRIGWDETGLAHPILVDPVWTTTKGVMVDGRQRHAAVHIETKGTACVNGCVLVFGGFKSAGGAVVTTTELYDESSGTFTAVPSPTKDGWAMAGLAPVAGGAKAMVFGGRVYPAGLPSAYTTLAYVYDPESSSTPWTAAPSLSEARSDFCVTWDAKSIWVSGGMNVVGPSNAVDVFDGTKWNSTAKLYKKRASHFCGHIVNKDGTHPFLVAGGMDDGYVDTDTVEAFVEDSPGTWTPKYWIGKLSQAKSEGGSVNVSPTVMLAIGGRLATKVERLAEYTSTSETMLGLRHSRPGVAPYRGGALVVGGSDAWGDRASLIDESGKTVETYPVVTPRVFAALTTMKSGAVLMTGGSTPTPPTGPALVLASAEVFDLGANGLACAKGSDCLSGFCVDGLCCDKGCTGQCEACNLPKTLGKCTTVDGSDAPTGYTKGQAVTGFGTTTRTLCASFDALCGFRCDGTTSTACSAAKTTVECTPGSCADGVETKPAFCNGTGECAASTKANCGDFACGPKGCVTKCAADTDCVKGRKCTLATGTCDPPKATCTNATTSQPVGGPAKDCTPYACDPATGACLGDCTTSDRCAPGYACADRACVPSAAPVTEDGGCTIDPRRKEGWAWSAALLALGWLGRRRKVRYRMMTSSGLHGAGYRHRKTEDDG